MGEGGSEKRGTTPDENPESATGTARKKESPNWGEEKRGTGGQPSGKLDDQAAKPTMKGG